MAIDDVGALALTHAHLDHFLDLYPVLLCAVVRSSPDPPRTPGVRAARAGSSRALDLLPPEAKERVPSVFDIHEVEPGETFHPGPFTVRTALMRHYVPDARHAHRGGWGVDRVQRRHRADTESLVALAAGADVLVAEATLAARDGAETLHLSAVEAGEHAAGADAGRLVLSHLRVGAGPRAERAAAAFRGDIAVAEEGMVVTA